jgi:hypothetical protein
MPVREELEQVGYGFQRGALGREQLEILAKLLPEPSTAAGVRNLLWRGGEIRAALEFLGIDRLAEEALGERSFAVSAIAFDKTADANWKVPGHQDLMVPVEARVNEPGFDGWSWKAGVLHVEAPVEVLSKLIALRIHLDDCPASNGALAVIAGSHHRGKLRDAELAALAPESFTSCEAAAGDVLFMKPLLVHRSSPALSPSHRRVLHVVYASDDPGKSLRWRSSPVGKVATPVAPPTAELFEVPPERPRRKKVVPGWLAGIGAFAWLLLSLAMLVGMMASLVHNARSEKGLEIYTTFCGYRVSAVGAAVTCAVMVAAVIVGAIIGWWQERAERKLERQARGRRRR